MVNTVSKINLSKIGWEGGGSTSIWIMFMYCFFRLPLRHTILLKDSISIIDTGDTSTLNYHSKLLFKFSMRKHQEFS